MELFLGIFSATVVLSGSGFWLISRGYKSLSENRVRSLLGFSSGFLVALALLELLPLAFSIQPADDTGLLIRNLLACTLAGALFVLMVDRWVTPHLTFLERFFEEKPHHHHLEHSAHDHSESHELEPDAEEHPHVHASCGHPILAHGASCSALACLVVCAFFDGISLSIAFQNELDVAIHVWLGQMIHLIAEGVLATLLTLSLTQSKRLAGRVSLAMGVAFLLGSLVALVPGAGSGYGVAFSAGILLFVSVGQLIPATQTHRFGTLSIVAGVGAFLLLHAAFPHGFHTH